MNIMLYGFLGGIVRALVGLMKSNAFKQKFNGRYLLFTLLASGLIGVMTGLLIMPADYRIILLAGYAGTDLLEGVYRIKFKMGGGK